VGHVVEVETGQGQQPQVAQGGGGPGGDARQVGVARLVAPGDKGGETVALTLQFTYTEEMLDNVPNIQASWVTQGARMAQIALYFGANDLGGTMLAENVVAAAGVDFRMSRDEIIELARAAGFQPARRTTTYEVLETY